MSRKKKIIVLDVGIAVLLAAGLGVYALTAGSGEPPAGDEDCAIVPVKQDRPLPSFGRGDGGPIPALVAAIEERLPPGKPGDANSGGQPCPAGYRVVAGRTDVIVCASGGDEMVKVGDFWIDRYEATIVDAGYWNRGSCDGKEGKAYGGEDALAGVSGFSPEEDWSEVLYACARSGLAPTRGVTWLQAQRALAASGKYVCTNAEWLKAAETTKSLAGCLGGGESPGISGRAGACESAWGVQDLAGNAWEWVDVWRKEGLALSSVNTVYYGSGGDAFALDAQAQADATAGGDPDEGCDVAQEGGAGDDLFSGAAFRCGSWYFGAQTFPSGLHMYHSPAYGNKLLGLRGCRRQ